MQELGDGYVQLRTHEGKAPGTLAVYRGSWRVIMEWSHTHRITSATSFTEKDFWALSAWLHERGDSESTLYHRLILLKMAFNWAPRKLARS